MQREDFEHVIAAAANATDQDEFVVVGSQAILGPHPTAPEALLRLMEAISIRSVVRSSRTRSMVRSATDLNSTVAWCLEVHDLVLSKCVAGRERDWEFAGDAMQAGLVDGEELLARVGDLPVATETRAHVRRLLQALIEASR